MTAIPNLQTLASVNAELTQVRARMMEQKLPELVADEARLERRVLELQSVVKSADKDAQRIGHSNCSAFLQWYTQQPSPEDAPSVPAEPEESKLRFRPADLGRIPEVSGGLGAIPVITEDDPNRAPFETLPGAGPRMKDKGRGGRPRPTREESQREAMERKLGPREPEEAPPASSALEEAAAIIANPDALTVGPPKRTRFRSLPDRYLDDAPVMPYGPVALGFERRSAFKPTCEAVAARHEGQPTRPSVILYELRKLGLKHRTALNCLDRMTGNLGKQWTVK